MLVLTQEQARSVLNDSLAFRGIRVDDDKITLRMVCLQSEYDSSNGREGINPKDSKGNILYVGYVTLTQFMTGNTKWEAKTNNNESSFCISMAAGQSFNGVLAFRQLFNNDSPRISSTLCQFIGYEIKYTPN
jgi:hypothetical protein